MWPFFAFRQRLMQKIGLQRHCSDTWLMGQRSTSMTGSNGSMPMWPFFAFRQRLMQKIGNIGIVLTHGQWVKGQRQ